MLIRETGEGLTNANSYVDDAMAREYCATRPLDWSMSPSESEPLLVRATDFIDTHYIFRSVRLNHNQALECPRFDQDGVPLKLIRATIELALIAQNQDLFALPEERAVQSESVTAGKVTKSKSYIITKGNDPYPMITKMLAGVASRRGASASAFMVTE